MKVIIIQVIAGKELDGMGDVGLGEHSPKWNIHIMYGHELDVIIIAVVVIVVLSFCGSYHDETRPV